jgi:hypothetical protein
MRVGGNGFCVGAFDGGEACAAARLAQTAASKKNAEELTRFITMP